MNGEGFVTHTIDEIGFLSASAFVFLQHGNAVKQTSGIDHEGEERRGVIIQGELVLQTETGTYVLEAGDAFVFDSSLNHTYTNSRETMLMFLVINYYPA